eukprot:jgi/Tetstr1/445005/TSEL_032813.t1
MPYSPACKRPPVASSPTRLASLRLLRLLCLTWAVDIRYSVVASNTVCKTVGSTGSAPPGRLCEFPFAWKGVEYSSCAPHDGWHSDWCGITSGGLPWGECACSQCVTTSDGGTVPPGTPCAFPFLSRGRWHRDCATDSDGARWCQTHLSDPWQWGYCACGHEGCRTDGGGTAPAGAPCAFPFRYDGVEYTRCTAAGHDQAWCYTASGAWGNCGCG